jgi:hypothetical protein
MGGVVCGSGGAFGATVEVSRLIPNGRCDYGNKHAWRRLATHELSYDGEVSGFFNAEGAEVSQRSQRRLHVEAFGGRNDPQMAQRDADEKGK